MPEYGGRYDGVVRKIFGDGSEGEQYYMMYEGEARKQLGILKNLMSFAKLEQLTRTIRLSDDVLITVSSVAGVDTIQILPPVTAGVVEVSQGVTSSESVIEFPSNAIIGSSGKGTDYSRQVPVIWKSDALVPVELPMPQGHDIGIAYKFSSDGSIIVGRTGIAAHGYSWPAMWQTSSLALLYSVTQLPLPPGYVLYPQYVDGMFVCTTDTGAIAFGHCPNNVFGSICFQWNSKDGATGLPYGSLLNVQANRVGLIMAGCSGNGSILVGNTISGFSGSAPYRLLPLLWAKNNSGYDFGGPVIPPEFNNGQTGGISGDGKYIAGTVWQVDPSTHIAGFSNIILWRNNGTEYTVLGLGQGRAISYDGSAIAVTTGNGRAAKWTQAGGFVDMGDPPPISGAAISPFGISAHGDIIVGSTNYSGFKWSGGQSITLLSPLTAGNICTAYDVSVLNPDPSLELTQSSGDIPIG